METCYPSFVKALQACFGDLKIPEIKALTVKDKYDLSTMLNDNPKFTHPAYASAEVA